MIFKLVPQERRSHCHPRAGATQSQKRANNGAAPHVGPSRVSLVGPESQEPQHPQRIHRHPHPPTTTAIKRSSSRQPDWQRLLPLASQNAAVREKSNCRKRGRSEEARIRRRARRRDEELRGWDGKSEVGPCAHPSGTICRAVAAVGSLLQALQPSVAGAR